MVLFIFLYMFIYSFCIVRNEYIFKLPEFIEKPIYDLLENKKDIVVRELSLW